jgi:hypothetical protein
MDKENATALVGLREQLNTIRSEVFTINSGLQNVAGLIQTDAALDQQRLRNEAEQERLLAEREIRVGQEEQLQQRISAALIQPVKKVEKTLTSVFSRITDSLKFLFTGVFAAGTIKFINSGISGIIGTFKKISTVVKSAFEFIGNGFNLLRSGFISVISGVRNVTGRIIKSATALAASPFKAIAEIFKNLFGKSGAAAPSTRAAAAAASSTPTLSSGNLFSQILKSRALRIGGFGLGAFATAQNVQEGDILGAGLSGAATIPSPIQLPATLASIVYEISTGGGMKMDNILPKQGFSLPPLPDFSKTFSDLKNNMFGSANLDAPAKEVNVPVADNPPTTTRTIPVVPFTSQVQTTPPLTRSVGPLPEPTPDVVYLQSGQKEQPTITGGGSVNITDVPLIPSGNSDNFYTLYAQVSYNVVI